MGHELKALLRRVREAIGDRFPNDDLAYNQATQRALTDSALQAAERRWPGFNAYLAKAIDNERVIMLSRAAEKAKADSDDGTPPPAAPLENATP